MRLTMRPRFTAGRWPISSSSAAGSYNPAPAGIRRRHIGCALRQAAIPRPDRDVGDRVAVAGDVFAFRQASVEHVELPLRLHGEAVDGIFDLGLRIGIEMAKAAADIGRAAHLPEEPGQAFGARGALGRQQGAELLGEIDEDRARFEDAHRLGFATVEQSRDLGIRIDGDKAAAELVALADLDRPGVVFGAAWPSARSSSSMMVTFTPLGVASE